MERIGRAPRTEAPGEQKRGGVLTDAVVMSRQRRGGGRTKNKRRDFLPAVKKHSVNVQNIFYPQANGTVTAPSEDVVKTARQKS